MSKACAYSCHQCLDTELDEFSELGEKDILINNLIDNLILIQITFKNDFYLIQITFFVIFQYRVSSRQSRQQPIPLF